jgi:hypothetical protein
MTQLSSRRGQCFDNMVTFFPAFTDLRMMPVFRLIVYEASGDGVTAADYTAICDSVMNLGKRTHLHTMGDSAQSVDACSRLYGDSQAKALPALLAMPCAGRCRRGGRRPVHVQCTHLQMGRSKVSVAHLPVIRWTKGCMVQRAQCLRSCSKARVYMSQASS